MKNMLQSQLDELQAELFAHIDGINVKFVSIIIDQIQPKLEKPSLKQYHEPIGKGELIQPSSFIVQVADTLSQVVKILKTNSSLDVEEMIQQTL